MDLRREHNSAYNREENKIWSSLFSVSDLFPVSLWDSGFWALRELGPYTFVAMKGDGISASPFIPMSTPLPFVSHFFMKEPDHLSYKNSQILDLANCIPMLLFNMLLCT